MQSQVRPCLPVHPRLRGELGSTRDKMTGSIGSSPLTRGTLAFDDASYSAARSIPAYAGNSAQGKARNLLRSVHPRLRGELAVVTAQRIVKSGSSPLTRGTQFFRRSVCVIDRFIPAYAGNSNDHFRHSGISRFIPAYAGNSGFFCRARLSLSVHPRLRGELGNAAEAISSVVRFIPAYAGNSRRQFVKRLNISVHPRLRGEL